MLFLGVSAFAECTVAVVCGKARALALGIACSSGSKGSDPVRGSAISHLQNCLFGLQFDYLSNGCLWLCKAFQDSWAGCAIKEQVFIGNIM